MFRKLEIKYERALKKVFERTSKEIKKRKGSKFSMTSKIIYLILS